MAFVISAIGTLVLLTAQLFDFVVEPTFLSAAHLRRVTRVGGVRGSYARPSSDFAARHDRAA